jgi:hypothetical protein
MSFMAAPYAAATALAKTSSIWADTPGLWLGRSGWSSRGVPPPQAYGKKVLCFFLSRKKDLLF